nr:uncharacterized protein LOC106688906 [Halyomorpha halys]
MSFDYTRWYKKHTCSNVSFNELYELEETKANQAELPPDCSYSPWSGCSSECGTGLSKRSGGCGDETRLCQHRPCPGPLPSLPPAHHRLRKGHECKATQREPRGLRLLFASCLSRRRYRPKHCGSCPGHTCRPELSTSLRVPVLCRQPGDSLEDSTLGADLWADRTLTAAYSHPLVISLEWVSKCECTPIGPTTHSPELLLHRVHRTAAP